MSWPAPLPDSCEALIRWRSQWLLLMTRLLLVTRL